MSDQEIMTSEEVAKLLRVSERTICDWAQQGEIPAGKLGNVWRFSRADIDAWLAKKLRTEAPRREPRPTALSQLIHPDRVVVLSCTHKTDVLNALIDNLAQAPEIKDREALTEAVFRREELMSTGIGLHTAVPHVRIASVSDLVMSVAVNTEDIEDYESLDGLPVRILFLIAARNDQHAQHLKTLATISHFIKEAPLREELMAVQEPDALLNLLTGSEPA